MKLHNRSQFYKYHSAEGAIASLRNRTIRLSSPTSFNDPFDCAVPRPFPMSAEELLRQFDTLTHQFAEKNELLPSFEKHLKLDGMILKDRDAAIKHFLKNSMSSNPEVVRKYQEHVANTDLKIARELQDFFRSHFIGCFSETHDSLPMWSHYGNHHQGAVICFKCIQEVDSIFLSAQKVQYDHLPPPYCTIKELNDLLTEGRSVDERRIYQESIFTKAKGWSSEREWRISIPAEPNQPPKEHIHVTLSDAEFAEVYLGCRMTADHKEAILNVLKTFSVQPKVFHCRKSAVAFELEFDAIIY